MIKRLRRTYQLRVEMVGIEPPIWRQVLTGAHTTLAELHHILQIVMGWSNMHLHQFVHRGVHYGVVDPAFPGAFVDESLVKIQDLLRVPGESFLYEYDFGDAWEHRVFLERILPFEPANPVPQCINGKRACPLEDSGGPMAWLGQEFDPDPFDLDWVNMILHDMGMKHPLIKQSC